MLHLLPPFAIFSLSLHDARPIFLFILVGFFEEMFFRGYVINTMHERGNKKWVIYVVSAALFGLVHLTNPNVALFGIINIILSSEVHTSELQSRGYIVCRRLLELQ